MKTVLYIAASLDGFIADRDGGVDWIDRFTDPADGDYGYAEFYARVGALAMGRRTYEQVCGFGDWPYPGQPTAVFSHRALDGDHPEGVRFVTDPAPAVAALREEIDGDPGSGQEKVLWLVGGAALAASFRAAGLIDELVLTTIPVLLGEGVPLFVGAQPEVGLRVERVEWFASGIVQTHAVLVR